MHSSQAHTHKNIPWDKSHVSSKTGFNKFKDIEIIPKIFSNHNGMKLEINSRRKTRKFTNRWKLNNTLNNQWINEVVKWEVKKYLETNENITYKNLWVSGKAVLRGKLTAISAYIKKQERSQINNLTLCLKELEKQGKPNPVTRRKEVIRSKNK